MAFVKDQKFTKTPFKKQADVLSSFLRTNPMVNDDEKASLQETVGVLTWLNMLQIHWDKTKTTEIPKEIHEKLFEGRGPKSPVDPVID
jgi:hypothetical protein